jgi:hypothetical protein
MKPVNLIEKSCVLVLCHFKIRSLEEHIGQWEKRYLAHLLTENTLPDDSSAKIQRRKRGVLPVSGHHLPSLSPSGERHICTHRRDVFEFAKALFIIHSPQSLPRGIICCRIFNQIFDFLHRTIRIGQLCDLGQQTALEEAAREKTILFLRRCSDGETGFEVQDCSGHGLVLHDQKFCVFLEFGEAECVVGYGEVALLAFVLELTIPEPFTRQTRTTKGAYY